MAIEGLKSVYGVPSVKRDHEAEESLRKKEKKNKKRGKKKDKEQKRDKDGIIDIRI